MAMRVNDGVEPIKSPPGTDRDGSRPKPPKAVAHRDSLEATRSVPDHKKAKRRLTVKTVAFARSRRALTLPMLPLRDGVWRRWPFCRAPCPHAATPAAGRGTMTPWAA